MTGAYGHSSDHCCSAPFVLLECQFSCRREQYLLAAEGAWPHEKGVNFYKKALISEACVVSTLNLDMLSDCSYCNNQSNHFNLQLSRVLAKEAWEDSAPVRVWVEYFLNFLSTLLIAVTWKGLQLWLGDILILSVCSFYWHCSQRFPFLQMALVPRDGLIQSFHRVLANNSKHLEIFPLHTKY